MQIDFDADNLKAIQGAAGKSLGDELALMIGNVGENATLRRATCFKATEPIKLFGDTHPTQFATANNVHLGKYGSIVAFKTTGDANEIDDDLQRNICQHIIGMNPSKVGIANVDKPSEHKDEEKFLIHQEFLLDPSITVGELFTEDAFEIVDFSRFACGENIATSEETLNLAKEINQSLQKNDM